MLISEAVQELRYWKQWQLFSPFHRFTSLSQQAEEPQAHSQTSHSNRQNNSGNQRTQQPNAQTTTTTTSASNFRCRQPLSNLPSGVLPLSTDIVNQVRPRANRMIQEGGKKVNRALQGVRTSLSSFTQVGDTGCLHGLASCLGDVGCIFK